MTIEHDTRALAHVLHSEGLSVSKIAKKCECADSTIQRILHESTEAYEYKIDEVKKESRHNWKLIRQRGQKQILRQLDAAEESGELLDLRSLVILTGTSQDKESLLSGQATERTEHTGEFKHIHEMTVQEQRARLVELRAMTADMFPPVEVKVIEGETVENNKPST